MQGSASTTNPPFPDSPRVIYRKNPIAHVICQLRYPPILQIRAENPAAFQEKIRARYPLYRREAGAVFPAEVAEILAKLPIAPPLDGHNHIFSTEDGSRSITLSSEYIALTEQNYERWENFRAEIDLAKAAVEEIYRPSFYSRVGLRYIDIIERGELGLQEGWTC